MPIPAVVTSSVTKKSAEVVDPLFEYGRANEPDSSKSVPLWIWSLQAFAVVKIMPYPAAARVFVPCGTPMRIRASVPARFDDTLIPSLSDTLDPKLAAARMCKVIFASEAISKTAIYRVDRWMNAPIPDVGDNDIAQCIPSVTPTFTPTVPLVTAALHVMGWPMCWIISPSSSPRVIALLAVVAA